MPTMSSCIADVNECVRKIRTLGEKRRKATSKTLQAGIEGDIAYYRGHLDDCIGSLAGKLGEQYDWLGRNPSSPAYAEIYGIWLEGLSVYEDTCHYRERLPKQETML